MARHVLAVEGMVALISPVFAFALVLGILDRDVTSALPVTAAMVLHANSAVPMALKHQRIVINAFVTMAITDPFVTSVQRVTL